METESVKLNSREYHALQRKVAPHCIPLGIVEDGQAGVGSGTLVAVGTRVFVATAGHNLIREADSRTYDPNELIVISTKMTTITGATILRMNGIVDDEARIDVGYVEIRPESVGQGLAPYPLPQSGVTAPAAIGSQVFFNGFPNSMMVRGESEARRNKAFAAQNVGVLSYLLAPDEYGRTMRVAFPQDALDIASQEVRTVGSVGGWSGSGIWSVKVVTTPVWRVETELIGIQTSHSRQGAFVRACDLSLWVSLVARDYPDLEMPGQPNRKP